MATKPLVFLHPLSERLSQLKDSVEETAEAENIEIFELESLEEFNELAPHLGQFLILCSNPKLCARMLQLNTRTIKRTESKVIMLSAKQYPRKTIDRLNKLGLTDFIMENVAAKTLQYKVKLQMRSIVIKKEEEPEDVVLKKDDDERNEDSSTSIKDHSSKSEDPESADDTSPSNRSKMSEEEIIKLQKKILEDEEKKEPKEYPGKTSLVFDEDVNPNNEITTATEEENQEAENKIGERRSKNQADFWEPTGKEKNLGDLRKAQEEKKNALPWHKAKEQNNGAGKGATEKIDSVWSSKKNSTGPTLKEKAEKELAESKAEKLEKERRGEISEQENPIETHWEGEVLDYTKKEKDYGTEESLYADNIKKHYEGETQSSEEINQDFEPGKTKLTEEEKEDMVGVSSTLKKKDLLSGDSVKELQKNENLQTDSLGTDSYENEMEGSEGNVDQLDHSNMTSDSTVDKKSDTNLEGISLADKINPSDPLGKTDGNPSLPSDYSNDSQIDKIDSSDLTADTMTDKKQDNLLKHEGFTSKKSDAQKDQEKKRSSQLLDKIRKNREKNAPKSEDGFLRSPEAKKREASEAIDQLDSPLTHEQAIDDFKPAENGLNQADPFKKQEESSKVDDLTPDEFSNDTLTEHVEDDIVGDSKKEQAMEDMAGESIVDKLSSDDMTGESNVEKLNADDLMGETEVEKSGADVWDGFEKQKSLEIEDDPEEEKRKKRLAELYELKKQKLAELEAKEKKRKQALASEEDLYKKNRDWDEKTFQMENEKTKSEDDVVGLNQYQKNGAQNLESSPFQKSENYSEEVIAKRMRHESEEISLDESDLTDMERELLKGIKDLGEQTINYKKFRSGEEAITVERAASDTDDRVKVREYEKEYHEYDATILDGDIEEEFTEEEGDKVIHPDSKGIESLVKILNYYFNKESRPSDILNQVSELVNKERGFGTVSFFYHPFNTKEINEIHNGQNSETWEEEKSSSLESWSSVKLPEWSDKTFRDKNIQFVYPYFEGVDHLGFAVVNFKNGMKAENAARIEITLEAARSVYLSQRHKENGDEAIYNELKEPLKDQVLPFKKKEEALPEKEPRRYMEAKDNIILLEKKRQEENQKKIEEEKAPKTGALSKFWKRMFG